MTTTDAGGNARIFIEFEAHLMGDEKPSEYFDSLLDAEKFPSQSPFDILSGLAEVEQSPKHHPEGNVWRHTMLVTNNAAQLKSQSKHPRALMWAALLHDVGKRQTTKVRNGRITAYDHDKAGRALAERFLRECGQDEAFVKMVGSLVRWHMQALYHTRHLPYYNPKAMRAETDIDEIALLCLCDRLGRGPVTAADIAREQAQIAAFIETSRRMY